TLRARFGSRLPPIGEPIDRPSPRQLGRRYPSSIKRARREYRLALASPFDTEPLSARWTSDSYVQRSYFLGPRCRANVRRSIHHLGLVGRHVTDVELAERRIATHA